MTFDVTSRCYQPAELIPLKICNEKLKTIFYVLYQLSYSSRLRSHKLLVTTSTHGRQAVDEIGLEPITPRLQFDERSSSALHSEVYQDSNLMLSSNDNV